MIKANAAAYLQVLLYFVFSKLVQTCINLYKLLQSCSNLSNLVQTCLNLSKLVKTCQNLSKLLQTSPNLSKLVQTCLNFSKLSNLLLLLSCYSGLYSKSLVRRFRTESPFSLVINVIATSLSFWHSSVNGIFFIDHLGF